LLGALVTTLDPLGQLDLACGCQQRDATDVAQEELQRVDRVDVVIRSGDRGQSATRFCAAVARFSARRSLSVFCACFFWSFFGF
jgi:hypothetical protein